MALPLSSLIPELQPFAAALIDAAGRAGLLPRVTSTRRSHAEQVRLHRRYLAGLQPFFVAPPGTSPHEYGFAFDLVVSPFEALSDVGLLWESWGGYWGGRQSDPVHFQYPGFHQWLAANTAPVAPTPEESSFGIFPFSAPSPTQRSGLSLATWIPGIAGWLASGAELITEQLYPSSK